jgi:hypothetical protein
VAIAILIWLMITPMMVKSTSDRSATAAGASRYDLKRYGGITIIDCGSQPLHAFRRIVQIGAARCGEANRLNLECETNSESKISFIVFAARICGKCDPAEIDGVDVRAGIREVGRVGQIESLDANLGRDGL